MKMAVLADDLQKKELLSRETAALTQFIWADSFSNLLQIQGADAYLDLDFELDKDRIGALAGLIPGAEVLVNAVIPTIQEIGQPFIRINAWPGFLKRSICEIAFSGQRDGQSIKSLFDRLSWKYRAVPDTTGMLSPRIIAMIINEAYYTLEEKISTEAEIDTAMKLGTNYPYGPFEWASLIGLDRIHGLLTRLEEKDLRYSISETLKKRVFENGKKPDPVAG
jgi:3-hydroxybutyryl-CoA dehydrogenase